MRVAQAIWPTVRVLPKCRTIKSVRYRRHVVRCRPRRTLAVCNDRSLPNRYATMTVSELLHAIRQPYADLLAKAAAQPAVIVEPAYRRADGTLATEGALALPCRADLIATEGKSAGQPAMVDSATQLAFEPLEFDLETAAVSIRPFVWDWAAIEAGGLDESAAVEAFKAWFFAWFDVDDENTPAERPARHRSLPVGTGSHGTRVARQCGSRLRARDGRRGSAVSACRCRRDADRARLMPHFILHRLIMKNPCRPAALRVAARVRQGLHRRVLLQVGRRQTRALPDAHLLTTPSAGRAAWSAMRKRRRRCRWWSSTWTRKCSPRGARTSSRRPGSRWSTAGSTDGTR